MANISMTTTILCFLCVVFMVTVGFVPSIDNSFINEVKGTNSNFNLFSSYIFQDDFESGKLTSSKWTVTNSTGNAWVSTQTSNSGNYSMYTRYGVVTVTSTAINLSSFGSVEVGYWVRIGASNFSEDPDTGEDLIISYYSKSSTWIQLDRINGTGTPGQIFNLKHKIMGNAMHKDFKLKFYQTGGSGSGCDYYHIDDVFIKTPVDNDIAVLTLDTPTYGQLKKPNFISSQIGNIGMKNQTNITVQLKIDGAVKNSTNISSLNASESTTVTLSWTPTTAKNFTVEMNVVPVTNENVTSNNKMSTTLWVRALPEIWIDPKGFDLNAEKGSVAAAQLTIGNDGLANLGFEISNGSLQAGSANILFYTQYSDNTATGEYQNTITAIKQVTTDFTYSSFNDYKGLDSNLTDKNILIVPEQENTGYSTLFSIGQNWKTSLNKFLDRGGTIVICDHNGGTGATYGIYNGAGLMNITGSTGETGSTLYIVDSNSALVKNVTSGFTAPNGAVSYTTSEKKVIINAGSVNSSRHVVIDKEISNGHAILIGIDYFSLTSTDSNKIVGNSVKYISSMSGIPWLSVYPDNGTVSPSDQTNSTVYANATNLLPGYYRGNLTITHTDPNKESIIVPVNFTVLSAPHDMRVLDIDVPAHEEAGKNVTVTAKILNLGTNNETNITVQLKINGVVTDSVNVTSLDSGNQTEVQLSFKPMKEGDYIVEVYIVPVTDENLTDDNEKNSTINITAESDIWTDPSSYDVSIESGDVVDYNLTIGNSGLGELDYIISLFEFETSGVSSQTQADIDDTIYFDMDSDSQNDIFYYIYLYAYSSDDDTLDVDVSGYDGSSWDTIYTGSNGGSRVVVDGNYADKKYSKIRIEMDDTDNNDDINYTYRFILLGNSQWLSASPDNGTVGQLNQTTITLTLNASLLNPGIVRTNITIFNNDPDKGFYRIPFNVTVLKTDHDIRVYKADIPTYEKAGKQILFNATILNQGKFNETNITIQLKIDGVLKNQTNITKLDEGMQTMVTLGYIFMSENIFTVEINAVPVVNETVIFNNNISVETSIRSEPDIWLSPGSFEFTVEKDSTDFQNLTMGNSGLGELNYTFSAGIISTGDYHDLPADPNSFAARHDISGNIWSDGGNDAFDGYGRIRLTVGAVTGSYVNLTNSSYKTNNFDYEVIQDWPDWNVLRIRIDSVSEHRNDIDVSLSGNLGSDTGTQSFQRSFDFHGHTIKYMVTNDGGLNTTFGDPQVHHYLIPSNPKHLDNVYYNISGDNPDISIENTNLPVTIYIVPSYLSDEKVTKWVKDDLMFARETWVYTEPEEGIVGAKNQSTVKVIVNATSLRAGEYRTNLTVIHNDPAKDWLKIPVNLTVTKKPYDVILEPPVSSSSGRASTTVVYDLIVINEGKNNDTYSLTVSGNSWTTKIYDSTGTTEISSISVNKDKSKNIKVKVTVSAAAQSGSWDTVTVKATSQGQTSIYSTSVIKTMAALTVPFFDDFEKATLNPNWTVSASSGSAGVNQMTSNSGKYSMYTCAGIVSVTTVEIDTSIVSQLRVSYWVQRGGPFSEWPNSNEDLIVEYLNDKSQWVQLATFYGGGNQSEIFIKKHNLGSNALHGGFKLRFRQTGGSGSNTDYWHIDDVYIGAPPPIELKVNAYNKAPATVVQGNSDISMMILNLTAWEGQLTVTSISINLTGTGTDSDVTSVKLIHDVDFSDSYSAGDVILGSGIFSSGKLKLTFSLTIPMDQFSRVIIFYSFSLNASVGKTIGARVAYGDIIVASPASVAHFNVQQSFNTSILEKTDMLDVELINIAPQYAEQGAKNLPIIQIKLWALTSNVTVNMIDLIKVGTGRSWEIDAVKLYDDVNENREYDEGTDILIAVSTFEGSNCKLQGFEYLIDSSEAGKAFIAFDVSPTAGIGNTIGAEMLVGSIKVKSPDLVLPFGGCCGGPMKIIKPIDITPPAKPIGLNITNVTSSTITLEWEPNSDLDLKGYNVYRSLLSNPSNWGSPVNGNSLVWEETYVDTELYEDTTYYYVVTAVDEVPNESEYSNIAFATTRLGEYGPEINNSMADITMEEDSVDDTSINLYYWFADKNDDPLEFRVTGNNHITVDIDQQTGSVTLTPELNWNGFEILNFYAKDKTSEVGDTITVTVTGVNDPPEQPVILSPKSGYKYAESTSLAFTASCSDPDEPYGDKLTFSWSSNVSGSIGKGKVLTGGYLTPGHHRIYLIVSDRAGSSVNATVDIIVTALFEPEPEPEPEPVENETEEENETEPESQPKKDEGMMGTVVPLIIMILILLILIPVLLFMQRRQKRASKDYVKAGAQAAAQLPAGAPGGPPAQLPAGPPAQVPLAAQIPQPQEPPQLPPPQVTQVSIFDQQQMDYSQVPPSQQYFYPPPPEHGMPQMLPPPQFQQAPIRGPQEPAAVYVIGEGKVRNKAEGDPEQPESEVDLGDGTLVDLPKTKPVDPEVAERLKQRDNM